MAIDDNTSYELTGAQVKDLASKINAKADSSSLATVATSGSYNDLSDKPTIPTVNDGTLTIQHNGTTKGTFTANQSSASTVNIETIYADTISPATAVDPITTGMIADGAVTSAKIDWTTLGYVHNSVNTVLAPSTSFSDRLSLTIPATGKYKCDLHCYFQCVELRQNKYGQARILVNGTVPTEEGTFVFEAFVPGSADSYAIGSASASMALNLTQGDIVKLQVKVGSGYSEKFVNTWADLSLLRVG